MYIVNIKKLFCDERITFVITKSSYCMQEPVNVGIIQDPESNSPEQCVDIAVSSAEDPIKGHP